MGWFDGWWTVKLEKSVTDILSELAYSVSHRRVRRRKKVHVIMHVGPVYEQAGPVSRTPNLYSRFPGGRLLMSIELGATKNTSFAPKFVDKKGNPAKVDDAPAWSTDNTELLALTPSEDGLSCGVSAVGPLGTATLTMSADADLGEGVTPVLGSVEIVVTAGDAVAVELVQGDVTEQP